MSPRYVAVFAHRLGEKAAAKSANGGMNIGTINPGSTQNLSAELFKAVAAEAAKHLVARARNAC